MTEETAAKIVYHLLAGLAGFALFMVLAVAWDWGFVPRTILSTGTITTRDGQLLETRRYVPPAHVDSGGVPRVSVNQKPFEEEVRLPSGRWIACRNDCAAAYERAMK